MEKGLKMKKKFKNGEKVDVHCAAWMAAPPSARVADNAGAWAKFERPKKRLRFLRPLKFGRARMTEQGPQCPQRFLRCEWFSKRRC